MMMAIDQYSHSYHGLKDPRKDLLTLFGKKHAEKMYRDDKDGKSYHIGYIIAGLWLKVYEVVPIRKPA